MKRFGHSVFYCGRCGIGILLLLLACCKGAGEASFCLNGAWRLVHITYPDGQEYDYPSDEGNTTMLLFEGDSITYSCQLRLLPTGTVVIPDGSWHYRMKDKGRGKYAYVVNDIVRPLTVVDDTTFVLQETGICHTFVRDHSFDKGRLTTIRNLIADYDGDDAAEPSTYVFSVAETQLETTNHALIYTLIGAFFALLLIVLYAYVNARHRHRLKQQVQQLQKQRELRPQQVADAMRSVEEEFRHSDFCRRLRRRIDDTHQLSADDWEELEHQLQRVYGGFTTKLTDLCHMSQTELRVCMLIKIDVSPTDMATLLFRDTSSISTIRSRLYQKVFGRKGGARDWDEFVRQL